MEGGGRPGEEERREEERQSVKVEREKERARVGREAASTYIRG